MTNTSSAKNVATHEEIVFDLTTSCTKEQAVMKVLGLVSGDVFKKFIPITLDGISPDDLIQMHPATMTLEERLHELTEHARRELLRAAETDAPFETLHKLNGEVEEVWQLISHARKLLMDIDDELAKGPGSALRVDEDATRRSGVTHISLRSLEGWITTAASAESNEQANAHEGGTGKRRMPKSDDSLHVTLALAVTAFARKAGGKFVKSRAAAERACDTSDLNMAAICEHLADLAASQSVSGMFPDQSESSIKQRISRGFEIRRNALKSLG